MPVKIYMTNDAKNLYIALDIPDTYDMRPHLEVAEGGSDTFGLNIGVQGEDRSYSRILQFNTTDRTGNPAWFVLDGYFAQWAVATSETNTSEWGPDVAYWPIPAGVQSATVFDETHRVQEISIPLSDLGVTLGTVIRIGGCIRAAEFGGYNFHAKYPVGLDWGAGETYATYVLEPPTKARSDNARGAVKADLTYYDPAAPDGVDPVVGSVILNTTASGSLIVVINMDTIPDLDDYDVRVHITDDDGPKVYFTFEDVLSTNRKGNGNAQVKVNLLDEDGDPLFTGQTIGVDVVLRPSFPGTPCYTTDWPTDVIVPLK